MKKIYKIYKDFFVRSKMIFIESSENLYWSILVYSNLELTVSILSKGFCWCDESNQNAIRARSSKVETRHPWFS
jgi:hypothetical protein